MKLYDPLNIFADLSLACFQQAQQDQKIALTSHELRESGQSHRFRDEIEYVLDGIRNKDKLKVRRVR